MKMFQTGDLVFYDDPFEGESICIILADGCSGYGSDTRVIYVIYSFKLRGTYLAYHTEVRLLEPPEDYQLYSAIN